jgi:hypothetical protein
MIDFVPDAQRLSEIFSQAIAPTFFLGAVAAFVTLMTSRLSSVMHRVQTLNAIAEDEPQRAHLKGDLARLRRRAHYLSSGIRAALYGGVCSTVLLADLFVSAFFNLQHAYGAPLLFVFATIFLTFSLARLMQEARIGMAEADEYN